MSGAHDRERVIHISLGRRKGALGETGSVAAGGKPVAPIAELDRHATVHVHRPKGDIAAATSRTRGRPTSAARLDDYFGCLRTEILEVGDRAASAPDRAAAPVPRDHLIASSLISSEGDILDIATAGPETTLAGNQGIDIELPRTRRCRHGGRGVDGVDPGNVSAHLSGWRIEGH